MTVNTDMTSPGPQFVKACASGSCVEVAVDTGHGVVEVRDSKNPFADTLRYSLAEWTELCGEILSTGRIPNVVIHDEHRVWIGRNTTGEYKVLIFNREEIAEFVAGVFRGMFRVAPSIDEVKAGV